MIEWGVPFRTQYHSKNVRTKNEEIMDMILEKKRCSKICRKYPQLLQNVYKLARFRPQRAFRTDLIYYYGPPGTGKSMTVSKVLNTIRKLYPTADYYAKMGGLIKYFDGYDNQPICWIDDPVSPAVCRTGDEEPVQRFKTVVSTGEVLVEVKHGSMVFDSSLIIVTSNMDLRDMADACGLDNSDAMYRRFTDTCGAYCILDKQTARNKMVEHLLKIIACNTKFHLDIEIDLDHVIRAIPGTNNCVYDNVVFVM